jgi:hypothetical protein
VRISEAEEKLRELRTEFGDCDFVLADPLQDDWTDDVGLIKFDHERQAVVVARDDT